MDPVTPPRKKFKLHGPRQSASRGSTCAAICCGATRAPDGGDLFLCRKCEQTAYCSRMCQALHSVWHESACNAQSKSANDPENLLENLHLLSAEREVRVQRTCSGDGPQDVTTNIQESANGTKGTAARRGEAGEAGDEVSFDDEADDDERDGERAGDEEVPDVSNEDELTAKLHFAKVATVHPIVGWAISDDFVDLRYTVDIDGDHVEYFADELKGAKWTVEMKRFWDRDEPTRIERAFLECPEFGPPVEPGPFGRYIIQARLRKERHIEFDIRNHERLQDPSEVVWYKALELAEDWDLEAYWNRVRHAFERIEACRSVDALGFIPEELQKHAVADFKGTTKKDPPADLRWWQGCSCGGTSGHSHRSRGRDSVTEA